MIMDPVSTGPWRNATRLTRRGPAPGRFPGAETVWLSVVAGCASHMVGVAQLVEHRVVVAVVAGSSPVVHPMRSEEHTSELQSRGHLVCRLLLEKKNKEYPGKEVQQHVSPDGT